MDVAIIGAMIQAGAALGASLVGRWSRKPEPETDVVVAEIRKILNPHYDDLRSDLAEPQVRILRFLRDSPSDKPVLHIRRAVYPDLQLDIEDANRFDGQFKYRLEYLRAMGLARRIGASEYTVSNLGVAFLVEAQERGDYSAVFL